VGVKQAVGCSRVNGGPKPEHAQQILEMPELILRKRIPLAGEGNIFKNNIYQKRLSGNYHEN
jgi:hypothetical protein